MDDLSPRTRAETQRHLIITVHGIRTFGQWQDRLATVLEQNEPGVVVFNYRYGYFSVLAFLIPYVRRLVVWRFRSELQETVQKDRWDRVDLVGHSFGTHLIGFALRDLHRQGLDFRVHTVLLAGSVLKVDFPWRTLMDSGRVHRLVNDCGIRDSILVLSQAGVLFMGMAGRVGFNGMTHARFRNRYFGFGHGGYFSLGETPDDRFMTEWWLPLLTNDAPPVPRDEREGNALNGFWTFVLDNTEPIKIVAYTSIPVALCILFFTLWRVANANEERALRNLSVSLAHQSSAVRERLPQNSALLASQAINISKKHNLGTVIPAEESLHHSLQDLGGVGLCSKQGTVPPDFSPDGRWLAALGADGKARLWDLRAEEPGRAARVLSGREGEDRDLNFSADGRSLVTVGVDDTVRLWNLGAEKPGDKSRVLSGAQETISERGEGPILGLQPPIQAVARYREGRRHRPALGSERRRPRQGRPRALRA